MATATKTKPFTIIVDTREQLPFDFASVKSPAVPFSVVRQMLETGDYSVEAPLTATKADMIVIERKSLADLYGSVGVDRDRFEREFKRLSEYGYAALVIEATWEQIADPNKYLKHLTLMQPKAVVATLVAWSQRYGVHVFTCPGRVFAEKLTYRLLERWARDHQ
jgi:ERCC4-type nuclease